MTDIDSGANVDEQFANFNGGEEAAPALASVGGKRRKSRKSRKSRKVRKSRKSRKSRKGKKGRKSKRH